MNRAAAVPVTGACAPQVTEVYADHGSDVLLAGYAGGGMVELVIPGRCVHVYADEIDALAARLRAVASGAWPD